MTSLSRLRFVLNATTDYMREQKTFFALTFRFYFFPESRCSMSQAELNTFARQVQMTWMEEKNTPSEKKVNPGTSFLRKKLRERREQQRRMESAIASKLASK